MNRNSESTHIKVDLNEKQQFMEIQKKLAPIYRDIFPDRVAPRTVIIIPSLSLDIETLSKVTGAHHYEERMLCLLILLRTTAFLDILFETIIPKRDFSK